MERAAREALKIVKDVNAHHGAQAWAEFDPEGAELFSELSIAQMRDVLDELEQRLAR
jgi:hypothetical protein